MSGASPLLGRLGSVQGWSQLCWPWLKIYSPVNAPGKAAPGLVTVPGCGWARPIKAPLIPEASDLAWVQTPGGGLDVELSEAGCRGTHLAETAMLPAPTTPRGLNVTSCHRGASPGVAGMSPEAGPCTEPDFCIYLLFQPSVGSRL